MDVLKFGGSSVGTKLPLGNLMKIVSARRGSTIVVVSALGGVTDKLIEIARMAGNGDEKFRDEFVALRRRHIDLMFDMFKTTDYTVLAQTLTAKIEELRLLLDGVFTLRALPEKTLDEVISYGEKTSAILVSACLPGSILMDSTSFIKTFKRDGKNVLNEALTDKLVHEAFSNFDFEYNVAVVPGFISSDTETGNITNLGRGGSDYTASILAASLGAEKLEIWTDVDGFMTADPRIIKTSYVIDELSFADAMELCNFGAKVVYPPALTPVYQKDIPILIKNTFNPDSKGTVIRKTCQSDGRAVTGISSISDSCILTVSGTSMVGVVGVDSRIFSALASHNISVYLVSQSSSETHISIGVNASEADLACSLINEEFAAEISNGSMDPVQMLKGLSTVAVVGERMKSNAGTAGKLFSVLGRNGISIIACAQGTEERNISFVVDAKFLRKTLNVIHDSFFLSEYQELNLFICGIGTVGGNLISQIASQREKLMTEHNLKLNVVGIARSTKGIFDRDGIDLATYKIALESGIALDKDKLREEVIGMNIFNSVFVDCTASADVASLYESFLESGISVVAANKVAASSDYENYSRLKSVSLRRGVKFLFETNVGAGLPIINTINALRNSGDKIEKIEAVVSGTLNFICNTISADIPFSRTVKMAQEQGFSEPDPRLDLSGKDVIRKLVILARESGAVVEQSDVKAELFIPKEFFDCSLDEFWEKLPSLDADFEARRKDLEKRQMRWRFVASMVDGKYSAGLREVPLNHSFYELEGSNNIVLLTTERYHEHPMLIQGYGAGAAVTAAGVFADIMSIAKV